jgi:hypothetical protein
LDGASTFYFAYSFGALNFTPKLTSDPLLVVSFSFGSSFGGASLTPNAFPPVASFFGGNLSAAALALASSALSGSSPTAFVLGFLIA